MSQSHVFDLVTIKKLFQLFWEHIDLLDSLTWNLDVKLRLDWAEQLTGTGPWLDNEGVAVPIDRDIPDLTGWVAYCPTCDKGREVRRARERDAAMDAEYIEFICIFCQSTLLTLYRRRSRGAAT